MARISGVDITDHLRLEYALQKIYGVGPNNVWDILEQTNLDADMRAKDLTEAQISDIQKVLDGMLVLGELRRKVNQDVTRLKQISAYRGVRHNKGLPARGQRTKTNARTKRGARKTVGAFAKEA